MPVHLCRSSDIPQDLGYDSWFSVGEVSATPDAAEKRLKGIAYRLDRAFTAAAPQWWEIAREIAAEPTGSFSHVACCAPSASDFGSMLAWTRLIKELAQSDQSVLAICDDPWLFRQLRQEENVSAGSPPSLWPLTLKLRFRGLVAQSFTALRLLYTRFRFGSPHRATEYGKPFFYVYGHPQSRPDGFDAYFADMMSTFPQTLRMIHTDCRAPRARELSQNRRTFTAHAWGSRMAALKLIGKTWTPSKMLRQGAFGWLIKRAATHEAGGASAAMTAWQIHCQNRWLDAARPSVVIWPWENHPWEKALARACAKRNIPTVGYLHTAIGPQMINNSPNMNPDGLKAVPDRLLLIGPGYVRTVESMGLPSARLVIAGTTRFAKAQGARHDPEGPVFVALSSNLGASRQMLKAVDHATPCGRRFLIKAHPMYPVEIIESDTVRQTPLGLMQQESLSAVVYCASIVGMESMLLGIPTIRFLPDDGIAMDVLPSEVKPVPCDLDGLQDAIGSIAPADPVAWEEVFAAVDLNVWASVVSPDQWNLSPGIEA